MTILLLTRYHVARKAIPYYDCETHTLVKPKSPNGIKMESFIFDVFPFSKSMGCVLVPRSEFTPVKNSNGRLLLIVVNRCQI